MTFGVMLEPLNFEVFCNYARGTMGSVIKGSFSNPNFKLWKNKSKRQPEWLESYLSARATDVNFWRWISLL